MAFAGDRMSGVIIKYAGDAGDARLVNRIGSWVAEIVDVKSGTGSDPFFRGPFEL